MGIMGHFFADVPSRVVTVVRHRGVWFLASLMCYMTGVGGMIFCIIRNPKSHGFDQVTWRFARRGGGSEGEGFVGYLINFGRNSTEAVFFVFKSREKWKKGRRTRLSL